VSSLNHNTSISEYIAAVKPDNAIGAPNATPLKDVMFLAYKKRGNIPLIKNLSF